MSKKIWILAALLSGCATAPPASLSGGPFSDITPAMAQSKDFSGSVVRWGGTIAEVSPEKQETCFQIVSRPLDSAARPEEGDASEGRFIACGARFYDPVVYSSGRELTVVGTLQGRVLGKIGGYDYLFPKVAADKIYLWPKRVRPRYYPYYYRDPFWYGPWPYGAW